MTKQTINLENDKNLTLLDQKYLSVGKEVVIISPICPDYHFKKITNPMGQAERIHDFDGLGEEVGIVYEKLITCSESFFEKLRNCGVKYRHILLLADVERRDRLVLKKLGIDSKEFLRRVIQSCMAINFDLQKRGLLNSKCMLMDDFFESVEYPFDKNINKNVSKLSGNSEFIERVHRLRFPLHEFWFSISEGESRKRSIHEVAMYASFGQCPQIASEVILCADSEVLSGCYNLFKVNEKTPVIYLKGNY